MSGNFTDYIVLEARDWTALAADVFNKMTHGFQCQGGVAIVALGDDEYLYAQAMVHFPVKESDE